MTRGEINDRFTELFSEEIVKKALAKGLDKETFLKYVIIKQQEKIQSLTPEQCCGSYCEEAGCCPH